MDELTPKADNREQDAYKNTNFGPRVIYENLNKHTIPAEITEKNKKTRKKVYFFLGVSVLVFVLAMFVLYFYYKYTASQIRVDDLYHVYTASVPIPKEEDKIDLEIRFTDIEKRSKWLNFQYKIKILLNDEVLYGSGELNVEEKVLFLYNPTNTILSTRAVDVAKLLCKKKATFRRVLNNINFETPHWTIYNH